MDSLIDIGAPPPWPPPPPPTGPAAAAGASSLESADDLWLRDLAYPDVDTNLVCPICTVPFLHAVTLPCGHSFCAACLATARDLRNDCPACRQPIDGDPAPAYALRALADDVKAECAACGLVTARKEALAHARDACVARQDTVVEEPEPHGAAAAVLDDANGFQTNADADADDVAVPDPTPVVTACANAPYCSWTGADPIAHAATCPATHLTPFLASTAARLASVESRLTHAESAAHAAHATATHALSDLHRVAATVDALSAWRDVVQGDIEHVRAALANVELRAAVELQTEVLKWREDVLGLKAYCVTLKGQVGQVAAMVAASAAATRPRAPSAGAKPVPVPTLTASSAGSSSSSARALSSSPGSPGSPGFYPYHHQETKL
ncbi:hypothetical protein AMAG_14348 [Allomyces macrogynus ATCC 38327]|uniref:RING-type domain-containing protein n=1 Tax=Allomyces macrogynus (strain ATCC 38327) TaxID=578462 RepID=A0A0L0T4Z4_ALLM3|nr:hypothetical protein AMAG_14348 [Allomyces macrogynus ATCC 38327]|eukprot:KNE69812.1 hypothetical protein AMAG_14348 [Allomyces macrogynus ATCC 38327]